jgi:hypothetical protein
VFLSPNNGCLFDIHFSKNRGAGAARWFDCQMRLLLQIQAKCNSQPRKTLILLGVGISFSVNTAGIEEQR